MKFLVFIGILLIIIFLYSFKENSKHENTKEAAKSGLWSAGGCLFILIIIILMISQCSQLFNEDSYSNRKMRDISTGEYDPYDDSY